MEYGSIDPCGMSSGPFGSPLRRQVVTPTDLSRCTATELLALYRAKACSPVEAVQAVLSGISSLNDRLNAFRLIDPERALVAARESEERWRRGEPRGSWTGFPPRSRTSC